MPKLNLDALKDKKRVSERYRPYDIPTPSLKEEKDNTATKLKENNFAHEKSNENIISTPFNEPTLPTIKDSSTLAKNHSKAEIEAKLWKEEVERLKKQLIKKSGRDNSIPSLEPKDADFTTFKFKNKDIDNEVFYEILKLTSSWQEAERKLFLFILEKTNFAKIDNVQIGRREIENNRIYSNSLKDAREKLEQIGILSFKTGYIGTSKKRAVFYSINLRNLFQ